MFAARVRASLKPLFHGRNSSYLNRNCEIAEISRRISHDRFNDGARILTSLRTPGNGVGTKLFYRAFHSSPQSYTTESDVELGSVEEDGNEDMTVKLLIVKPEPFQVEKTMLSQKTKSKKKTKKKKHVQASISKLKLLTEKPEISWKISGKSKREAHASSPERNITDSNVSFSKPTKSPSPAQDHNSTAQKETSSKGSSTSKRPSWVVVIRIGNLNSKTADSMVHSMCLSIGPLKGISRVNEKAVEVLYRVRDLSEADSILEELNDANVDYSQWKAEIVPKAEEAFSDEIGMRIVTCYEDSEKQLTMRQILTVDLGILLHSVTRLENHPMPPPTQEA